MNYRCRSSRRKRPMIAAIIQDMRMTDKDADFLVSMCELFYSMSKKQPPSRPFLLQRMATYAEHLGYPNKAAFLNGAAIRAEAVGEKTEHKAEQEGIIREKLPPALPSSKGLNYYMQRGARP